MHVRVVVSHSVFIVGLSISNIDATFVFTKLQIIRKQDVAMFRFTFYNKFL